MAVKNDVDLEDQVSWGAGASSRKQILRVFIPGLLIPIAPVAIIMIVTRSIGSGVLPAVIAVTIVAYGVRGLWWLHVSRRRIVITNDSVTVTDKFTRPISFDKIQYVSWVEAVDHPEWRRLPFLGQLMVMSRSDGENYLPDLFVLGAQDRKDAKEFVEREFSKRGVEVRSWK